jgi:PTH1 family peptidyl-tRNA hydrolase
MQAIIGLGNPGEDYKDTRHNMGFMVLDKFVEKHNLRFRSTSNWEYCFYNDFILVKPLTYMNLSGTILPMLANKHNVDSIYVVYDDYSIPFGTIRIRPSGSHGGHNGMKSIISFYGSNDFPRQRMGIGVEHMPEDIINFVLGKFRVSKKLLEQFVSKGAEALETYIDYGINKAMNTFNKKVIEG